MSAQATEQITDAEVVEEITAPASQAVVPYRSLGSTELIHAESAAERVAVATEIATQLDAIIKAQGMRTKIGRQKVVLPDGKEEWRDKYHVNVEAWQTLATFLGLAVVPASPEPIRDDAGNVKLAGYEVVREVYPKGTRAADIRSGSARPERVERAQVEGAEGFTCRVEVLKDGVLIGAGSSRCTRLEEAWRDRPDYALEGMAQTRATSRAIGAAARWIVTLAGYSGTPTEEMPAQPSQEEVAAVSPIGPVADAEDVEQARRALMYLLGLDSANAARIEDTLRTVGKLGNGVTPKMAVKGVAIAAGALKRLHEDQEGADAAADATREAAQQALEGEARHER